MNYCSCGKNCSPEFTNHGNCQTCKPQLTEKADYGGGYDDNGNPRRLKGSGIYVSDGESVFFTDGSEEKGFVPIDLENIPGSDYILSSSGGKLYALGRESVEGSILMYKSGKWVVTSNQTKSTTFDPSKLRTGGGTLASFICGANGMVELGTFGPVANSLIYWNDDKLMVNATLDAFVTKMLIPFCANIPEATASQEIKGFIACTDQGLVKTKERVAPYYWLSPMSLIAYRGGYNNIDGVIFPTNLPLAPTASPGLFTPGFVDVDLTAQPGYSESATMVTLDCFLYGQTNNSGGYNMSIGIQVQSIERMRTFFLNTSYDTDRIQIVVPIPVNKIIRVDFIRDVYNAPGGNSECIMAGVYLTNFISQ